MTYRTDFKACAVGSSLICIVSRATHADFGTLRLHTELVALDLMLLDTRHPLVSLTGQGLQRERASGSGEGLHGRLV